MTNDHTCKKCDGIGYKVEMRPIRFGSKIEPPEPCTECQGSGKKTPRHP